MCRSGRGNDDSIDLPGREHVIRIVSDPATELGSRLFRAFDEWITYPGQRCLIQGSQAHGMYLAYSPGSEQANSDLLRHGASPDG